MIKYANHKHNLNEEQYRFLLEKGKASTVAKELLGKKIDEGIENGE